MESLVAIGALNVGKVAKYKLAPVGRQIGYLFFYSNDVSHLKNQIQELKNAENRMQQRVHQARRNGEEIQVDVQAWLHETDMVSKNAKDFIANKGYELFATRMPTLRGTMEALKDPNISIIGVYGMGGVGKTMLAKEVIRQAQEERLFGEVVIATVSYTRTIRRLIQQEIAEKIGIEKFHEIKSIGVRAVRLRHRLRQEHNILVVLDDIWEIVDLIDIGIYVEDFQIKACKRLLTS